MKNKYFSNQESPFSAQQFNELLQQIENGSFTSNSLLITSKDYEGILPEGAIDINDDKAILLANALQKNPNINNLDLTHNNIGNKGASALANVNTLHELNLWGNNIEAIGSKALANSNLKKLDLGENFIIYNKNLLEITEVTDAFNNNKTIVDLSFYNCNIPDTMIAQIIKSNKTIKKLNLSGCNLTDEVLKYIGNNQTLESLYLYGNNITDLGAEYISQNHSLIDIDFGNNTNLTDVGARFLSNHPTLKNISLNSTTMTIEELREVYPQENNQVNIENSDINLVGNIDYDNSDDIF